MQFKGPSILLWLLCLVVPSLLPENLHFFLSFDEDVKTLLAPLTKQTVVG